MAPPSFTKGKVALLDPFFFFFFFFPEFAPEGERGSDARSVPRFGDVQGKKQRDKFRRKKREAARGREGKGRRQSETKSNRT